MQVEKNVVDIVTIAGTRPEIIKLADLVQLLDGQGNHASSTQDSIILIT